MLEQRLQQLASQLKIEQEFAQKTLVEAGQAAVPVLLEALQGEENQLIRIRAAAILGEIGDERVEAILIGLLQDADARVRHVVIHALGRRQSAAAGQALQRVAQADPDISCRKTALFWLAQTVDQASFDAIFTIALKDASLRGEAIWNIGRVRRGGPQIVDLLLLALDDSDDRSFPMLIWALGVLRDSARFRTDLSLSGLNQQLSARPGGPGPGQPGRSARRRALDRAAR